jgi:P27 family predicted phage terminase small subunit
MAGRGFPPKPTRLKILSGEKHKDRINTREPQPRAGIPSMPSWLSTEAKVEWRRIVPELKRLQLITLIDRTALAAYCQAHAELARATKLIDKDGLLLTIDMFSRNGELLGQRVVPNPAIKLQRDAFQRVKQFIAEFGLTPSSRSRIQVPMKAEETDPLQELMNRRGKAR